MSAMKEDVYESEDVPERPEPKYFNDDLGLPEEIERIHIDIETVMKKFQGRLVSAENVDFSDSIAAKGKRSYGSTGYVLEVIGKGTGEPETPAQKFNRLYLEISELGEEISNQKAGADVGTGVSTDLLKNMLDRMKANQDAPSGKKSGGDGVNVSGASFLDGNVAAFEKRIQRIEGLLGDLPSGSQPLVSAVEDLRLRADVLNPNFLESTDSRLNTILSKMKQVDEKKEQAPADELERNVDELLALMKKWDPICTNLPSQVKKLNSLARLHECAQQFAERMGRLSSTRELIEKEISSNRENFDYIHSMAKKEITSLVTKIEKMEARLDKAGK
ncbi:unnamed protein product, partial [Mesorhabditis spiculigera]